MAARLTSSAAPALVPGRIVDTPEGRAAIQRVFTSWDARASAYTATRFEVVPVPGTESIAGVRNFRGVDVTLAPAPTAPRESVEDFMARKADPKWKTPKLRKPAKPRKLTDEKLSALMASAGWTGSL